MKVIDIPDDIGVKNIKGFYSTLKDTLKNESEIHLNFSKVKRIDLSLAQVLLSAGKESKKENKCIKLKGVSEDVKRLLRLVKIVR